MIEYEIEFTVIGTFLDQVYDCENEDKAIEIVLDRLRTDPIRITETDVDIVKVTQRELN